MFLVLLVIQSDVVTLPVFLPFAFCPVAPFVPFVTFTHPFFFLVLTESTLLLFAHWCCPSRALVQSFLFLTHRLLMFLWTLGVCDLVLVFTLLSLRLQDMGQLSNYHNQIVLDTVHNEGETNEAVDVPNAIYIDDVETVGLIRTGVAQSSRASTC